jgi:hypothetical protein
MFSVAEDKSRLLLSILELSYLLEESGSVSSLVRGVLPFPSPDFAAQAKMTAEGMLRVRLAEALGEVSPDGYANTLAAVTDGVVSALGVVRLAIRGEDAYRVIAFFGLQLSVELVILADAWVEVSLFTTTELATQLVARHLSLEREFDVLTDSSTPNQASLQLVYSKGVLSNGEMTSVTLTGSLLSSEQILGGVTVALEDRITAATASHGD